MKKALLILTLTLGMLGAQAQTGVRTITNQQTGTTYEFGQTTTNLKASSAITGDAELVWHLNDEYAEAQEVYVSDEIEGTRRLSINWFLNNQHIAGYENEDETELWQIPLTGFYDQLYTSKDGSLGLVIDQPDMSVSAFFAYVINDKGAILDTIEINGSKAFGAIRSDGTGYYIGVRDGNGKSAISYYSAETYACEWSEGIQGNVVTMAVAADNSRLVVGVTQPEKLIYVLDAQTGSLLQDDIYYYCNSPTQAPALNANGEYLAYTDFSGNGTLMKWNGEKYVNVWKTSVACSGESSTWGQGQAISPDGKHVAFGTLGFVGSDYDGAIFLFNNYSSTPEWVYENCGDEVEYISFSDDGSLMACAGMGPMNNSTADLLIFRTQSSEPYMELGTPGSMFTCMVSPDGKYVITGGKAIHARVMGYGGNAYLIKTETEDVGTLAGTVNVSDAVITINELDDYYIRSNSNGSFSIRYIPEGTYSVTITKTGYTPVTLENIVINGGETTNIQAILEAVGTPVTNLYATHAANATNVGLMWDAYTGSCEGYNIYRKDAYDAPFGDPIGTSTEAEYFDATAIPTHEYYYAVTANLGNGIETPYSNVSIGWASTTFLVTTAEAYTGTAPSIDGQKGTDEWNDAFVFDISDFTGKSNNVEPAGSVLAYVKTDGNKMYFAVEVFTDETLDANDCVAMYWDDNCDRQYPTKDETNPDDSEGNYWMKYTGSATSMTYRPLYDGGSVGTTIDVPDAELQFGTVEGHVFVEYALVIGDETYNLTPANNMSGMYMYYRSQGTDYHAYWPYNNNDTFDPIDYNTVIYNAEHNAPAAPENLRADLGFSDMFAAVYWDDSECNDIDHYVAYVNGQSYQCPGTTVVFATSTFSTYEVYVVAVDHSGLESAHSETLTFTTGGMAVNENDAQQFAIYPNPASGQVTICGENIRTIELFNISGQTVKKIETECNSNVISVENLEAGVYFVVVNGKNAQKLIVK